ncbi:hypothetical protein Taro_000329 [Colocasia esculenta]|uniref:Uncharacterized protein n=1 Tax=Colocasia esculenta TaxID=4460 RepID=A0A843T6L6_COLES|nr:hypothetical protein [Colocasia esculenta]
MAEVSSSSAVPTLWYPGWRISHQNSFMRGIIDKIFDNLLREGYIMAHDLPPTYTEEEINHPCIIMLKAQRRKSHRDHLGKRRGLDGIKSHPLMYKAQGARSRGNTSKIYFQMRSRTPCITKRAMSSMGILGPAPNKAAGQGPGQSLPSLPCGEMKTEGAKSLRLSQPSKIMSLYG